MARERGDVGGLKKSCALRAKGPRKAPKEKFLPLLAVGRKGGRYLSLLFLVPRMVLMASPPFSTAHLCLSLSPPPQLLNVERGREWRDHFREIAGSLKKFK